MQKPYLTRKRHEAQVPPREVVDRLPLLARRVERRRQGAREGVGVAREDVARPRLTGLEVRFLVHEGADAVFRPAGRGREQGVLIADGLVVHERAHLLAEVVAVHVDAELRRLEGQDD